MPANLDRLAIHKALQNNWEEALNINKEILKEDPDNAEALMRAARAFFELGRLEEALASVKKVLRLDPLNLIALRCDEKWSAMDPSELPSGAQGIPNTTNGFHKINLFLEEPGKTKIVNLHHLGDTKLIATLDCGDEVQITAGAHKVTCTSPDGHYIGRFPDDIATKTIDDIKKGSTYKAHVKSITASEIKLFIKQISPH
jgi:tetratricopeptide (TPR) repeat protein